MNKENMFKLLGKLEYSIFILKENSMDGSLWQEGKDALLKIIYKGFRCDL